MGVIVHLTLYPSWENIASVFSNDEAAKSLNKVNAHTRFGQAMQQKGTH